MTLRPAACLRERFGKRAKSRLLATGRRAQPRRNPAGESAGGGRERQGIGSREWGIAERETELRAGKRGLGIGDCRLKILEGLGHRPLVSHTQME